MGYTADVQGDIIILRETLPVANGTEMEIAIPPTKGRRNTGYKKPSVISETCGLMPSDAVTVRAVLEEEPHEI